MEQRIKSERRRNTISYWTYIDGTISVELFGNTQPQMQYILDTVLAHLPKVSGSEGDMDTYVIRKKGWSTSMPFDEFGQWSNLGNGEIYGNSFPEFKMQDKYIIVVDGSLRDTKFEEAIRAFQNWLCRLAKRIVVQDVFVRIGDGWDKSTIVENKNNVYLNMFEYPSWDLCNKDKIPAWSEYMYYECVKGSSYPLLLAYKYFEDDEVDKEVERRMTYRNKQIKT